MRYGHRDLIIKCRQRPSPSRLARGLTPLFPLSPASFRTGRGEKLGRGSFVCNSAASSKMGDAVFGSVGLPVAEICRGDVARTLHPTSFTPKPHVFSGLQNVGCHASRLIYDADETLMSMKRNVSYGSVTTMTADCHSYDRRLS